MIKQPENGRGKAPPKTEEELKEFKEFRLTSFAIDHSTSVILLFIIMAIAGIVTYTRIPKESFPELEIPMIAVSTVYPGVSPADIETLVTRPIEDELNTIGDIKELTSTSVEGYSSVVAEFETTVDLERGAPEGPGEGGPGQAGASGRRRGPDDPRVQLRGRSHHAGEPVRRVRAGSPEGDRGGSPGQDRADPLHSPGRPEGGLEREVKVDVDLAKLKFYGLAMMDVVDAIQIGEREHPRRHHRRGGLQVPGPDRRGVRGPGPHRGSGGHHRGRKAGLRSGRGHGGVRVRGTGDLRPPGRERRW